MKKVLTLFLAFIITFIFVAYPVAAASGSFTKSLVCPSCQSKNAQCAGSLNGQTGNASISLVDNGNIGTVPYDLNCQVSMYLYNSSYNRHSGVTSNTNPISASVSLTVPITDFTVAYGLYFFYVSGTVIYQRWLP